MKMLKSSVLLVIMLCISFNTAHRINREDTWAFLLRNAMARMHMQSSGATTCREASLDPGCCVWNGQSCHVEDGECYCDNLCKLFDDCCCDVLEVPPCDFVPSTKTNTDNRCSQSTTLPESSELTTIQPETNAPTTPLPPTCSDSNKINSSTGCCENDDDKGCFIEVGNDVCFCDRGCYSRSDHCCNNLMQDGCYPRNCMEAGKLNCTENCSVQISANNTCYCDKGCTHDCCDDAQTSPTSQVPGPSVAQIENLLKFIEKEHSTLYERMAAAFWRRYNNMKRKQQKKVLNQRM